MGITQGMKLAAAVAVITAFLLVPSAASASYPIAQNGRIAYEGFPVENGDIFLMGSDGSNPIALTNPQLRTTDSDPAISPNGRWIAFGSDIDPNPDDQVSNLDIIVMSLDGSQRTDLTTSRADGDTDPAFSPDGKRIAFVGDVAPGNAFNGDIFIVNSDGTGLTNLTNSPTISDGSPDFSPDGKSIVFISGPFGNHDIWRMGVDGTALVNLTSGNATEDTSPSYSPDGTRIAFARDVDPAMGAEFRLFVMNADGSGASDIAGQTLGDGGPAFSPDGTRIALSRVVEEGPENSFDIFTVSAGGGAPQDLTSSQGVDFEFVPAWEYVYKCAGRQATIVGSDSKDKIKGTKKADVIVSNGGKDKIRGRGGNDRICGGKGKDTLIGGAGKDRLIGGKGKDKVVQ